MDRRKIGAGLREIRERRGLGLRATADLAGISPSLLCRLEKGEKGLTITVAAKLDRVLPGARAVFEHGQATVPLHLGEARVGSLREIMQHLGEAARRPEEWAWLTLPGGGVVVVPQAVVQFAAG